MQITLLSFQKFGDSRTAFKCSYELLVYDHFHCTSMSRRPASKYYSYNTNFNKDFEFDLILGQFKFDNTRRLPPPI